MQQLEGMGKVRRSQTSRRQEWVFTEEGLRSIRAAWDVCHPRQFCILDESVPLMDRTPYELLLTLRAEGWQWGQWVPVSQRSTKVVMPVGYKSGDPKLWFTSCSTTSPRSYMLVLLKSEETFVGHMCVDVCVCVLTSCTQTVQARMSDLLLGMIASYST